MYSRKYLKRKLLGIFGELYARRFLKKQGVYQLATNYRTRHGEVDYIGFYKKEMLVVEVKLRTSRVISGVYAVGKKKLMTIRKVAEKFCIHMNYFPKRLRIDIISILVTKKFPFSAEITWIQDIDDLSRE